MWNETGSQQIEETMEKEQEILARLRQDIVDNNLHVKAIIQVSVALH